MDVGIPNLAEQFARSPVAGAGLVLRLPFLESFFFFGIQPGPALRFGVDATGPGFGSQAGSKTFMGLAEFPVKWVSPQRLKHAIGNIRVSLHQVLRCQ